VWLNGGCKSWYIDRNGINSTLWPDHTFRFFSELKRFDVAEYVTEPAPVPAGPAEVVA
jgi:cyclohexanone monooxygenase